VWLGEELRCARLAAGYTSQDQFARELGFDRTVIVKAETGARPPSEDMAARIAEMFPELCNGLYVRLAGIAEVERADPGLVRGLGRDRGQGDHPALVGTAADPRATPDTIQVIPGAAGAYAGLTGAFAVAEVPGESPTAYLETGVQGITVRDPTLVSSAARMFDDLRDEALSRSKSLELIAEVEKS